MYHNKNIFLFCTNTQTLECAVFSSHKGESKLIIGLANELIK